MHISLDSELGRQRRLNQIGEPINTIATPAAAYSLRSLTGGDPKVVRVRRESDNDEQDFTASEVASGAMLDYVNAQVTAPLDIKELTSGGTDDGRNGNFLIAKAAYSLRSLGTRQATVAATGDTVARANGKYVCQVRSVTGDIKSFTATEVSDGTLVDFVLGNTKSLLNSRAYLDGSNDNVGLTSEINLTGDFSLEYSFVVTEASQQIIGKNAGGSYLRAEGSTEITGFRIQTNGSASTVSLTSNLKYGEANTIKLKRVSGKFGIYNESDTLISAEFTNSDTFTISSFGKARGSFAKGVIYNIRIDTNNDGTINHSYNGYGNTLSDWQDLVGSNNAAAVNGSPALFTGQDQDGFVKTWYDQSVTTQAGDTATGNHATQSTADNQPTIVENGSLITGGGIAFDGSDDQLEFTALNASDLAIFSVVKFDAVSSQKRILGDSSDNTEGFGIGDATNGFFRGSGGSSLAPALNATISTSGDFLYSLTRASDSITFFTKGVASGANTRSDAFKADSIGGSTNPIEGNVKEIIIYETDQTDNRTAIEANIGEVYNIDLPSGVDPGFDQVNGFVERWYDQSGNNRDSIQNTAARQPIIVDAGTFQDGLKFTHTDTTNGKRLFVPRTAAELGDTFALVFVGKVTVSDTSANNLIGGTRGVEGFATGTAGISIKSSNGTISFINEQTSSTREQSTSSTTVSLDTDFVAFVTYEDAEVGPDLDLSVNGNKQDFGYSSNLILTSTKDIGIMNATGGTTADYRIEESPTGICREILVYDTEQFDNRVSIETNINNHYSIF